ncbi:MAG: response regulator [Halieaceae bacterium]|nr:response regulator [Halieaceae bacterium]
MTNRAQILVVDDEPDIVEEIAEALIDEGFQALCAENVDTALQILRSHENIKVVVTDMGMPGKTGANLIGEARAEFKRTIRFIVVSGVVNDLGSGMENVSVLAKPLDINNLLSAVKAVLLESPSQSSNSQL